MTALAMQPLDQRPNAVIRVPGSKSHTNRALICAALASGVSTLRGALFADDTAAMVSTLETLGLQVEVDRSAATLVVHGVAGVLPPGPVTLDVRQSGTTGRFVLPMLGLGSGTYRLDGHAQLRNRPFDQLVNALRALGMEIVGQSLPLTVNDGALRGGDVTIPGSVSSQFLSGLLLSAPCAVDGMTITVEGELVSKPYIDLTLHTMALFGAAVERDGYQRFRIRSGGYEAADAHLEPDASAASYFFAAAAITGGTVRIDGLGADSIQGDLAFVDVLEAMGASVERGPAHVAVTGPPQLCGVEVDLADFSDTAQTLAVVASFADRPTTITGIGFIRHKETDRIEATVTELQRRGIQAEAIEDGMVVHPGRASAGTVETYDDHRMAMSFALLGLVHPGIEIGNPGCVAKTFPSYFQTLDGLR